MRPVAARSAAWAVLAGVASLALGGSPLLALLVGLGGAVAAGAARRRRRVRERARLLAQLPILAAALASALRAGRSLPQALARAAVDVPVPLRDEVAVAATEARLGSSVGDALDRLAGRVGGDGARLLAAAVRLQERIGGDQVRCLEDLADRLDRRERIAAELRAATAQARLTAWLVASLPVVGGAVAEAASPGVLSRTLGTGPGLGVLTAAALLQGVGILIVRRVLAGLA